MKKTIASLALVALVCLGASGCVVSSQGNAVIQGDLALGCTIAGIVAGTAVAVDGSNATVTMIQSDIAKGCPIAQATAATVTAALKSAGK